MGIQVEFNPDLALRAYGTWNRESSECLPEKINLGEVYNFLKKGQRNYWLYGEIPLRETKGKGELSRPLASIIILRSTHTLMNREVWTTGLYKVIKKIKSGEIYFNGLDPKDNFE